MDILAPLLHRVTEEKNKSIQYGRVVINPDRISSIITNRRQSLGLSLRGLAAKAGVSLGTVVALEQGKHNVQLEKLLQVLAVLDLLPQDLWETEGVDIDKDALQEQLKKLGEGPAGSEFLTRLAKVLKSYGL